MRRRWARWGVDAADVGMVVRYGLVGLAASAIYTALVIALVEGAGFRSPVLASIIAFVLAVPVSYLGHWAITFGRRQDLHEGWGRFIVTATTSFAGAVGGMYVLVHFVHLPYYAGLIWTWAVVPPLNFLALRLWVFARGARVLLGSRSGPAAR